MNVGLWLFVISNMILSTLICSDKSINNKTAIIAKAKGELALKYKQLKTESLASTLINKKNDLYSIVEFSTIVTQNGIFLKKLFYVKYTPNFKKFIGINHELLLIKYNLFPFALVDYWDEAEFANIYGWIGKDEKFQKYNFDLSFFKKNKFETSTVWQLFLEKYYQDLFFKEYKLKYKKLPEGYLIGRLPDVNVVEKDFKVKYLENEYFLFKSKIHVLVSYSEYKKNTAKNLIEIVTYSFIFNNEGKCLLHLPNLVSYKIP